MAKDTQYVTATIAYTFNKDSLVHKPTYTKQLDSYNSSDATIAKLKAELDVLSKSKLNISSLSKKLEVEEKRLSTLGPDTIKELNMTFPTGTPNETQLYQTRVILENNIQELKANLETKKAAKANREAKRAEYELALKNFQSAYRKGYAAWKKEVGVEYTKIRKDKEHNKELLSAYPPDGSKFNYKYAKSKLVDQANKVIYGILLEEDEISSSNFKTSKLSQVVQPLAVQFGEAVTKAVLANFYKRVSAVAGSGYPPPSAVESVDFVGLQLTYDRPVDYLFATDRLKYVSSSEDAVKEVVNKFNSMTDIKRKKAIYDQIRKSLVATLAGASKPLTDDVFVPVLCYLIEAFVAKFCECCKANTVRMNNQITIKPRVVHTLIQPLYIMHGKPYAEMEAWINAQMSTVKK